MIGRVRHLALVQPRVGIGDMIWHLPHIRALARRAGGRVTLVARPRALADQLLGPGDGITDLFLVERDQWAPAGRHQGMSGLLRLVVELRARRFDAAVFLTHSRILAFAAMAARVPARYGYGVRSQHWFLNQPPALAAAAWKRHPHEQATIWLRDAGVPLDGSEPFLPVSGPMRVAARARLLPWRGAPVALGIGTSDAWKQWGVTAFADLAGRLVEAGWPALLLVGGEAERAVAEAILRRLRFPSRVVPVLGWDLRELSALLAESAFYVGNDTGALNLAAAVGTRAYGLFGGTPALRHSAHIVPVVPPGGPDQVSGMRRITVEAVVAAITGDRGTLAPAFHDF